MTTFTEPTGEAWIRQVNKRLSQLERVPRGTGSVAAGDLGVDMTATTSIPMETSVAFEADALADAGERSDTSVMQFTLFDEANTPITDTTPDVPDQYMQEDLDEVVPAQARTDRQFAPVTPTDPYIESRATGVAVIWDGLGAGGEHIPDNLLLVEVHRSTESATFEPTENTYAGSFLDAGLIAFDDQEYEVPWYYRFVLVTTDGLRSTPSGATVGTAHKVASTEVGFSASEIDFDGVIAAAAGTAQDALDSANGKNTITHEDFAPTNEANVANDTWFVHDPVTGVITGQWTGLGGTSWTQTTLSHQVISSVDLGTATVGKLSANYIDTGILMAEITVSGAIIAGDPTGARVIVDEDGIRQYASATALVTNLPTDPSVPNQFEGKVLADSLTTTDWFTMQGVNNSIARGSELRVAGGTVAPSSPPTLAVDYATYNTGRFNVGAYYVPAGVHGDTDNSPDVIGALTFFGYGEIIGKSNKWWFGPSYPDLYGTPRAKYGNIGASEGVWVGGAERLVINSVYTASSGAAPVGRLTTFDLSPMNSSGTVAPTEKATLSWPLDVPDTYTRLGRVFSPTGSITFSERLAVGINNWNSTVSALGFITLRQYTVTDSSITMVATTEKVITSPLGTDEQLIGVTHGSTDKMGFPGTVQYIWLVHGSVKTYAYRVDTMARVPDYDFPTPAGAYKMMAFGDLSTNEFLGFRSITFSESTVITQLTNNHWVTGTSDKWWVSQTWYDPDATGGTHETDQGRRSSIIMKKRAGLTYTIPTYPERPSPTTTDDPTSARVYIGRGAADPTYTGMDRVATLASPVRSGYIGTYGFPAPTNPPSSSNFPTSGSTAAPGKIASADGTGWTLVGNGIATFAAVTFDASKPGFTSAAMRSQEYVSDLSTTTTTSTTGATMGTAGAQGTFVAPPSGIVKVTVSCQLRAATAGQAAAVSFEVKTGGVIGSGSPVVAATINQSALNANTANIRSVASYPVSGLTAGDTYNIRTVMFTANAASTATIGHTRLYIDPST